MADVSIIVADTSRMTAIRDGVKLPGRCMHFNSGSLASAMESIRAYRPKIVAIDAVFAQTAPGVAFIERVDALDVIGCTIRLIIQHEGRWVTAPRDGMETAKQEAPVIVPPPKPTVVTPTPQAATEVAKAISAAAQQAVVSTRRAPRFAVRTKIDAVVDNAHASLIDISILGAQIVSVPALRPNQKIKIGLPDTDDILNVVASVAWSMFELSGEPRYRVGIEFSGAAQQALEEYRLRHCADTPIGPRG
jgi:hypothetical protein